MTTPSISVVIPTRAESAERVNAAIQSVLDQDVLCEILVVYHGAPPGAGPRGIRGVTFLETSRGLGMAAVPRNLGVAAAGGELVAFLDDDDLWLPGKLDSQLALMSSNPGLGLVSSDATVVDEVGREHGDLYLSHTQGVSGSVFRALLRDNTIICSSVLASRSLIQQVGGFSESPSLATVEDYHLWLRMALRAPFGFQREPFVRYRRRAEQTSIGAIKKGHRLRRRAISSMLKEPLASGFRADILRALAIEWKVALFVVPGRSK